MDELSAKRANVTMGDLGIQANEIRVQAALLAQACAWRDRDGSKDLAEDLLARLRRLGETYRLLLIQDAIGRGPISERMSV